MKNEISNLFRNPIDSYTLFDVNHPLDFYLGKDSYGRDTMLLISDQEPADILATKMIDVFVDKRINGQWALYFYLKDNQYEEQFYYFVTDMLNSSRIVKNKSMGMNFVCDRYCKWQAFLKKNRLGRLSFEEIKGLFGELYYLEHDLIPLYGIKAALNAWIGPEGADQDFAINDTWYEVKTVVSGASAINISSIEQLDTQKDGNLVVIHCDKTGPVDDDGLTLNTLVNEIEEILEDLDDITLFHNLLMRVGFTLGRKDYDKYVFAVNSIDEYCVNEYFPAIRRSEVPASVINVNYTIAIASIASFLKDNE